MKKLIVMLLLMLPMILLGQTKAASTIKPITVMSVPLGITAKEFKEQAQAIEGNLSEIIGIRSSATKLRVAYNLYEGAKDDEIVWQATLFIENEYLAPHADGFKVTSTLSAKYGAPESITHMDYGNCLRWNLRNGYIQAWYKGKSFYAQFVDYNALKKAYPELYKQL